MVRVVPVIKRFSSGNTGRGRAELPLAADLVGG